MTGVLRVFSSVTLLLFAATTTTLVHPAGASTATASTSLTDDDDAPVACPTAVEDCRADDTCFTCMENTSSSTADVQACYEEAGIDDIESSTATCDNIVDGVCCLDEASAFECMANDAYVAYWVCFLDLYGCSEETFTCNGGTVSDSAVDDDDDGVSDAGNDDGTDAGNDAGNDDGTDYDGNDDDGNGNVDSAEGASNGATTAAAGPAIVGHSWIVSVFSCAFMVLLPILCA